MKPLTLLFASGTLEVRGLASEQAEVLPGTMTWDARTHSFRGPALNYADVVNQLRAQGLTYEDKARRYTPLPCTLRIHRSPRPYQRDALEAWTKAKRRAVVVLPTGAGKSHLAVMAIAATQRPTLVIAPTLDLVRQWYDLLRSSFDSLVGLIGGGEYRIEGLTISTYDSAHIHMENIGNRFGLVVFDECHHLPSTSYALAAQCCLAPFRLGLSATPERSDGREQELNALIGPFAFRKEILDLSGNYLSEYETVRIAVDLSPDERDAYRRARQLYRSFLQRQGIHMAAPDGWNQFIQASARSQEGREAMEAYRRQRKLAFAAPAKLEVLAQLLHEHRHDRSILFTDDNATAYHISERFLVPVITHQSKVAERSHILDGLREGTYHAVVTSKVLNEGVDVPSANVAVVLSGSGSVREHVQRLGRILRKKEESMAVLYELVTADTSETFTSARRREHLAYR